MPSAPGQRPAWSRRSSRRKHERGMLVVRQNHFVVRLVSKCRPDIPVRPQEDIRKPDRNIRPTRGPVMLRSEIFERQRILAAAILLLSLTFVGISSAKAKSQESPT